LENQIRYQPIKKVIAKLKEIALSLPFCTCLFFPVIPSGYTLLFKNSEKQENSVAF